MCEVVLLILAVVFIVYWVWYLITAMDVAIADHNLSKSCLLLTQALYSISDLSYVSDSLKKWFWNY